MSRDGGVGVAAGSDRPRVNRPITGMSAVLLPLCEDGTIDWPGFEASAAAISQVRNQLTIKAKRDLQEFRGDG